MTHVMLCNECGSMVLPQSVAGHLNWHAQLMRLIVIVSEDYSEKEADQVKVDTLGAIKFTDATI